MQKCIEYTKIILMFSVLMVMISVYIVVFGVIIAFYAGVKAFNTYKAKRHKPQVMPTQNNHIADEHERITHV